MRPLNSDSPGLVCCAGHGVERCKNLEAEDLGSSAGPSGHQPSCVILAKSLGLSEPQIPLLSYIGVYLANKTMTEKVFCQLLSSLRLLDLPLFSLGLFYNRLKISYPQFQNAKTSEKQHFLL